MTKRATDIQFDGVRQTTCFFFDGRFWTYKGNWILVESGYRLDDLSKQLHPDDVREIERCQAKGLGKPVDEPSAKPYEKPTAIVAALREQIADSRDHGLGAVDVGLRDLEVLLNFVQEVCDRIPTRWITPRYLDIAAIAFSWAKRKPERRFSVAINDGTVEYAAIVKKANGSHILERTVRLDQSIHDFDAAVLGVITDAEKLEDT